MVDSYNIPTWIILGIIVIILVFYIIMGMSEKKIVYTYYPGVDLPDKSILAMQSGGIQDYMRTCSMIPACAAFTANGLLKGSVSPRDKWAHYDDNKIPYL